MNRFVFFEAPPRTVPPALAACRADLAALRMQWALVKLALKYRPDQPRVPAGSPQGGQWTDAGGDLVSVAANDLGGSGAAKDAQARTANTEQTGSRVTLPNGMAVANPYSKTGYLISPTSDLSPVAAAGRQAGALYQKMLVSPDPDVQQAALPEFIASIGAAVGHLGTFDYQRSGNRLTGITQLPQFRDVSNFNVGVYMQQTGQFSEQDTLSLAGTFARYFSSNYMPDQLYGLAPRTASLIRVGYQTAASGVFGKAANQ